MDAINRMTPTYAGAKNVLMLDSQVQNVSFNPECFDCAVELNAYILSSAWDYQFNAPKIENFVDSRGAAGVQS